MSWLDKAKNVEESLKDKKKERVTQQKEALAELKSKEKEHYPIVKELSPRVEKVCKAFARSIKGKLATQSPYWGKTGPACVFEIIGNGKIKIELNKWDAAIQGISVSTDYYTEEFYNKWPKHSTHENFPMSQFYRFLEHKGEAVFLWTVYYNIPWEQATEDELANVLETLCHEMQDEKARTYSYLMNAPI